MFTSLKTLFRRVDFYLRNQPFESHHTSRPFSDLFEGPPDPFRTRAYWNVRRWAHNVWGAPRSTYYAIKHAYQRLTRGWDDRAVWSIDWWLDDKMPAMLRQLKEDKHGIPTDMFEGLPTENNDGYTHSDETYKIAEARWDVIIDKIIAAFEASRRMQNGVYEEELGEYPLRRPEGVSEEDWKKKQDERYFNSRLLDADNLVIFEEGMALFVKHYHSLWD